MYVSSETNRGDGGPRELGPLSAEASCGRRPPAGQLAVSRANATMMRAVAVFIGRAVLGATPVTTGRRPVAAEVVFGGMSPGGGIR